MAFLVMSMTLIYNHFYGYDTYTDVPDYLAR